MGLHPVDLGHRHRPAQSVPRRDGRRGRPAQAVHLFFQVLLAIGCGALWWAYPNRPDLAQPIAWAVVLATVGAEMSIVFNNAQLPNIVRPERMGWLSGFGWGLGYVGGLIALRRCVLAAPGRAAA
jgi:MFS-type transporter involved in bile tolerance (Atg22 family)